MRGENNVVNFLSFLSRRDFLYTAASTAAATTAFTKKLVQSDFKFRFLLASSMYGTLPVAEIIDQAAGVNASAIDIWPEPHGNQREQVDEMGDSRFAELLQEANVTLGCVTQFKLGPFALSDELRWASQFDCETIVTGSRGPKGLTGDDLKSAVDQFVEKMQPQLEVAEETGITIAIENHSNSLINSPESIRYLVESAKSQRLAIALAPYHLDQDAEMMSKLIRDLGDRLELFYAWQYGKGCMKKLPKEDELMQMPGRGELDFEPIIDALKSIKFSRWTEIFMHPVPRGIPILETADKVTAEINRARVYLEERI